MYWAPHISIFLTVPWRKIDSYENGFFTFHSWNRSEKSALPWSCNAQGALILKRVPSGLSLSKASRGLLASFMRCPSLVKQWKSGDTAFCVRRLVPMWGEPLAQQFADHAGRPAIDCRTMAWTRVSRAVSAQPRWWSLHTGLFLEGARRKALLLLSISELETLSVYRVLGKLGCVHKLYWFSSS